MAKDLVALSKERGVSLNRRGFPRTLGRLFPHDNPYSGAMWRLAIIRDDICREIDGVALPVDADEDRVWEHGYFLRHLSVSVLEAKSVFGYDISKMLKDEALRGVDQQLIREKIDALKERLDEVESLLRPIRDKLGGHVRPDMTGLRTHSEWPAIVTISDVMAIGTSYRDATKTALLFAWPEVTSVAELDKKLEEFAPKVIATTIAVLNGIDGVLYAFWIHTGAMEPGRL